MLHAPGFASKCIEMQRGGRGGGKGGKGGGKGDEKARTRGFWRRGANDSAIRYREDKFRFSRVYSRFAFSRYQGRMGGEIRSRLPPLQKFDRNTKSTRTLESLSLSLFFLLLLPLSLLSFSASVSVVIRRIPSKTLSRGGDELRGS